MKQHNHHFRRYRVKRIHPGVWAVLHQVSRKTTRLLAVSPSWSKAMTVANERVRLDVEARGGH